jgi:hypothetical protein
VVELGVPWKDRVAKEEGSADFEEAVETLESIDGAEEEDARGACVTTALYVLSPVDAALDDDEIEA